MALGQNFCRNCGLNLRQLARQTPAEVQLPATPIRGLGSRAVVFPTPEGLNGTVFRSSGILLISILLPAPLLVVAYLVIQEGAFVVYASTWIVLSLLIYDELRWRGFRHLEGDFILSSQQSAPSWLVPWRSVRMAFWNGRTLWFTSTDPPHKMSITFDRNDAPLIERSLMSWGVRYSWRRPRLPQNVTRFSTLALLLFAVGQLILVSAAVLPFFPGEEQLYSTILNNTESHVTGTSFMGAFKAIFTNNLQVAWDGMLPVLGQLFFGLANYNTGRVIQVIAITENYPPFAVLISLYLLPHTWLEESAYPVATVAGLLAVTRWRSISPNEFAHRINWGSWKLILSMGGVAAILITAGLIETAGLYLGAGELLLWIPIGAVIYLIFTLSKARRRANPPPGSA